MRKQKARMIPPSRLTSEEKKKEGKKKKLVELEQVSRGRVATIRTLSYRCVDAWGTLGPAPFHSPRLI